MEHHHHDHSHGHHHIELKGKNLLIAILLNVLITVSQIIGAIFSHSLSLMTDALHNLSDVMALVISYVAHKLAKRKPTSKQSFGYKRAEILAAFINAATLLGVSVYLIVEAMERLFTLGAVEVGGELVMWLAGLSILANGLSVLLIQKDAKKSMNMKAAYLHLFSDMLTSIAVLVGGFLMIRFGWYWVDSLLSVMIAVYLIISSWNLVVGAIKVLMQFTPKDIDVDKITQAICVLKQVKNVHHVHIWQLTDHEIHFEAHIDCEEDMLLSEVDKVMTQVRELISHKFNIHHATLQPEFHVCDDKSLIAREE
ncbi:cation diffusion facilitator family transporter [Saccharicrinis fermentans]|uniref:Cadmium, cobalt and zinc/H(+)-K(+) antiporter n=1 Tax=Saccharicrinis fermentans DSM 9555 = JCM 21142 TaxID=869213 RepID=W7YM77_9BACT|nr:cation diffusion facilitator family transporter [Saccharicrinis fermentans]GAF05761.1 cadmium, cobalt and zinc/H(+)-K(+) antiporter [Saccharicrinis fermentans DSM 9555 = JCM 21142]